MPTASSPLNSTPPSTAFTAVAPGTRPSSASTSASSPGAATANHRCPSGLSA
jgi:hypothetical protein